MKSFHGPMPKQGKKKGPVPRPPSDRFWAKVDKTEDCWVWTGATGRGYGRFGPSTGVTVSAHRFAYEELAGPIPSGLDLDHLCRNRACVNPAHLEPVTRGENVRRGMAGRWPRR